MALAERYRLERIARARVVAAELIARINTKGGPFAHATDCACCGCRASRRVTA